MTLDTSAITYLVVGSADQRIAAMSDVLRKQGCEVLTADSARAGLEVLNACQVDVIVVDGELTGEHSLSFLRQADQVAAATPRFLLSSLPVRMSQAQMARHGLAGTVLKTASPEAILATVTGVAT